MARFARFSSGSPGREEAIEASDLGRSTASPRRVAPIVLAVPTALLVATVAMSATVHRVIEDQDRRVLADRAGEAAALTSTSLGQATTTLPLLGALAHVDEPTFRVMARAVTARAGGSLGVVVVSEAGVVPSVVAGDGTGITGVIAAPREALFRRARQATGVVSGVVTEQGRTTLTFAVAVDPREPLVAFQDVPLDPSKPFDVHEAGVFGDIQGAVYAAPTADPSQVVFTTPDFDSSQGQVEQRAITIGADRWLVLVKANGTLVGSLAASLPWLVLACGTIAALLMAALLQVLARRRAYALALVDERTSALRAALAEKEELQEGERRARATAEAANQSKSEFLSRMSHELRTPLNAVLGFAQLLELDDLTELQQESVRQILKGGAHLLDLINEVLDITRIETGKFALSPEPVLVGEVVDDVLALTRRLAIDGGVHLDDATGQAAGLHVLADRQRLKQILLNLVGNAIKYNQRGGTVAVSCMRTADDRLRIRVTDTGPGIAEEHLELAFTPFERLGAEQTGVEGAGVGLALSRRLAEVMGGTLEVESTTGVGSVFWVELPTAEGPVERYERLAPFSGEQAPEQAASLTRHTVVYIEDNLSNLRLVQRILADRQDIELLSATSGREGLHLIRQRRPALVLLDLHLGDMTGDAVLREMRADEASAAVPVVIVSADATPGQVDRLLQAGVRDYLTKPLDVRGLQRVLDDILEPTR